MPTTSKKMAVWTLTGVWAACQSDAEGLVEQEEGTGELCVQRGTRYIHIDILP